jgi:hypothetical protein
MHPKEVDMPKAHRSFVAALAAVCAIVTALGSTRAALAQAPNNPVGQWSISFFVDNNASMPQSATQTLCFLANGTWYSPSFAGWHGRWFQKGNNSAGNGDILSIIGNYSNNAGNDSAALEFVSVNLMTGAWNEWRDNFTFVNWTRASVNRTGKCGPQPAGSEKAIAAGDPSGTRPK